MLFRIGGWIFIPLSFCLWVLEGELFWLFLGGEGEEESCHLFLFSVLWLWGERSGESCRPLLRGERSGESCRALLGERSGESCRTFCTGELSGESCLTVRPLSVSELNKATFIILSMQYLLLYFNKNKKKITVTFDLMWCPEFLGDLALLLRHKLECVFFF